MIRAGDPRRLQRRAILFGAILLSGGNLLVPRLPLAIAVLLLAVAGFGILSARIRRRNLPVYLWLLPVILFAFLREQQVDVVANLTRIVNFALGLVLLKLYRDAGSDRLAADLRAVLMPLAYLGLATFLLSVVAPGLFVLVRTDRQAFYTFLGLLNHAVPQVEGIGFPRPIGVFWEPGVFQIYLNILVFVLFCQNARLRPILVAMLAVAATQSTTGIVALLIQTAFFTLAPLLRRRTRRGRLLLACALLALMPPLLSVTQTNVTEKLFGALSGSASARGFDMSVAVGIIREEPLIGIGFNDRAYIEYTRASSVDVSALSLSDHDGRYNTNGVMIVLYSLGIPLGAIYLLGFMRQDMFPNRLVFALITGVMLSSSPVAFTPFFAFLAFSGMSSLPGRRPVRHPAGAPAGTVPGAVPAVPAATGTC